MINNTMIDNQDGILPKGTDHIVLAPREHLRKRASLPGTHGPDLAAIERAESALKQLSVSFDNWMDEEVSTLLRLRNAAVTDKYSSDSLSALFHCAHDIKGQAATFGYPVTGEIAASLCYLIDHSADRSKIPPRLIDQHVDAIRATTREHVKDKDNPTAAKLLELLSQAARDVVDNELTPEAAGEPA